MELRASFQIPTLIKALTDVVLPAVDPNNKLALEQAQLIIGSLSLIASRGPLQYRYDCHDLARNLDLAATLQQHAENIPAATEALRALADSAATAKAVLDRARAEPGELEQANLDLRDHLGSLITAVTTQADAAALKPISTAVLAHAKEQQLRERAWLSPQGWEPGLPEVESLLAEVGQSTTR